MNNERPRESSIDLGCEFLIVMNIVVGSDQVLVVQRIDKSLIFQAPRKVKITGGGGEQIGLVKASPTPSKYRRR